MDDSTVSLAAPNQDSLGCSTDACPSLQAAGEAIQGRCPILDRFVASLLAMTVYSCVACTESLASVRILSSDGSKGDPAWKSAPAATTGSPAARRSPKVPICASWC